MSGYDNSCISKRWTLLRLTLQKCVFPFYHRGIWIPTLIFFINVLIWCSQPKELDAFFCWSYAQFKVNKCQWFCKEFKSPWLIQTILVKEAFSRRQVSQHSPWLTYRTQLVRGLGHRLLLGTFLLFSLGCSSFHFVPPFQIGTFYLSLIRIH
jgi:hypothetical protein